MSTSSLSAALRSLRRRKEKFGGREMHLGTMQDEVVRQWPVSFWVRGG